MESDIVTEFEYVGSLPTVNEIIDANRTSRFKGSTIKKKYTKFIAYEAMKQKIPRITEKVDVYCHWTRRNRRTDKDNISGGIKFILDGLQEAGVLKNDGWSQIGNIFHFFETGKENKVLIRFKKHREFKEEL